MREEVIGRKPGTDSMTLYLNKVISNKIITIMLLGWIFIIFDEFYSGVEPQWKYYVTILVFFGVLCWWVIGKVPSYWGKLLLRIWVGGIVFGGFFIFGLYTKESLLVIGSCLTWYLVGRLLLNWVVGNTLPMLDAIVFSLSIGMVLFSFLILGLGLFGKLYPIYLVVIIGLGGCFTIVRFYRNHPLSSQLKLITEALYKIESISTQTSQSKFALLVIVLVSLHFLLFIVGNLAPPFISDDVAYHLTVGKIFAQSHKISFLPFFVSFNLPLSLEMLHTEGVILGSEYIFIGLVNILYDFLLLGAFFIFGKKFLHPLSGILALLFLFSIAYYNIHGYTLAVDLKYLIYCILALYSFLSWIEVETKKDQWLWLTAIMTGLSLNFRYQGVILLAFFTLSLAIILIRSKSLKYSNIIFRIIKFLSIVAIFAFPWYLRNLINTGNPIFPTSTSFFHGFYGDPEMSELWRQFGNPNWPFVFGHYGFGTSMESFVKLPWRITSVGGGFEGYSFTPIYLSFLPLIFFFTNRDKLYFMFSFCLFYTIVWFFQMQQLKFLIPVFAIMGIIISDSILNFLPIVPGTVRILLISLMIFVSVATLKIFYIDYPLNFWAKIPVVLRIKDKDSYLLKVLPHHKIVNFMNSHLSDVSLIFSTRESRLFYLERKFIYGDPAHQILVDYRTFRSFEDFLARLKQLGVTHILTNKNPDEFLKDALLGPNQAALHILESMYDYRYLEKISETDDLLLLQVKYPENLPLYDNKQLMSPILIGDTLYKYGKLDSARQQYEKAYGLGFPEAKNKLEQINLMNHIDKGNYYLSKANEFRRDIYLKAALDEYQLAVEKDQDIFQKKVIAEKVDAVYSTAMSISPHIWGRLSRIKVE